MAPIQQDHRDQHRERCRQSRDGPSHAPEVAQHACLVVGHHDAHDTACAPRDPYTSSMARSERRSHPFFKHARGVRRRLRRRALALTAALLVVLATALVWQGSLMRMWLENAFSEALGGRVRIEALEWTAPDAIRLRGLTLTVPDWPGDAARIASIDRLEADIDVLRLIQGRVVFNSLVADGATVSIAEDPARDGALNIESLLPPPPDAGEGSQPVEVQHAQFDAIDIRRSVVHADAVDVLSEQRFAGIASPDPQRAGWTAFDLRLEGTQASLSGSVNQRTRALVANLQNLEALPALKAALPVSMQAILALNPGGAVQSASIQLAPGAGAVAQLSLIDLRLDLPEDLIPEGWATFHDQRATPTSLRPTLTIERADLRLIGKTIVLEHAIASVAADATGALPLRVNVSGELELSDTLPTGDGSPTLSDAAFALHASLHPLSYGHEGDPSALLLPMGAARLLTFFNLEQVDLGIDASLTRDSATAAVRADTTIRVEGGIGAFHLFSYRLTDIDALVKVTAEQAEIVSLTGRASDGALVTIRGTVAPLIDDPGVALTLSTSGVTVDDEFVAAFQPRPRRVFDTLLDRGAWNSLAAAGLISAGTPAGDAALPRCTLGGRVSFDLRIDRPPGTGEREVVTGRINLHDVDLVLGFLPLPVRVREGAVHLHADRLEFLNGGLAFEDIARNAPGQPVARGSGLVRGSILIPQGDGPLQPELRVTYTDLPLTPLTLACLPHEDGARPPGWPGTQPSVAARVLQQLGARGTVSIDASVTAPTSSDREVDVLFAVRLNDCSIDPALGAGEPVIPWPRAFSLSHLTGGLSGSPSGLRFDQVEARHGEARCALAGTVRFDGELDLRAEAFELPAERWLLDGLEPGEREAAMLWWDRYLPRIAIDAGLVITGTIGAPKVRAWARPVHASVVVEGSTIAFTQMDGLAEYDDGRVACHGIRGRCMEGWESACFDLAWDGSLLEIAVLGAGLSTDSPVVASAMKFAAPDAADVLARTGLHALVDVNADIAVEAGIARVHGVAMPRVGEIGSGVFAVPLAWGARDSIRFTQDRIVVDCANMVVPGGRASVLAIIDPHDDSVLGQLSANALLGAWYPGLSSVFGQDASRVLTSADAQWTAFTLDECDLLARATGHEPHLIVNAHADAADASFLGAAPIDEVCGAVRVSLESFPEGAHIQTDAAASAVRVVGRPLTGGILSLSRAAGEERVKVDRAGVLIGDGSGSARGWSIPGGSWLLETQLDRASVYALAGAWPHSTSGAVDASSTLEGGAGALRGAGRFVATDLTIGDGSIGLALLQAAQFTLPGLDRLSRAEGAFTLDGSTAHVRDLMVSGDSIGFEGGGTVDLQHSTLDLLLASRSGTPFIGQVLGALGNAFLRIRVTGTLADPRASLEPIPQTEDPDPDPAAPALPPA